MGEEKASRHWWIRHAARFAWLARDVRAKEARTGKVEMDPGTGRSVAELCDLSVSACLHEAVKHPKGEDDDPADDLIIRKFFG